MLLVVILVSIFNNDLDSSSPSITTIVTAAYTENSSDSIWDKFKGALLNSLVFVVVVTVVTFLLVLMFYLRCTKFLNYYMGFSAFLVLGFMGGEVTLFVIKDFSFLIDCVTFAVILFNFTVIGVLAIFMEKMAIFVKQGYLVVIGMLVAYWFTLLPEWTTWILLVAMALYDLAAVLLPGGPLRLLVQLAISRDEDILALVYEARPFMNHDSIPSNGVVQRRIWRERRPESSDTNNNLDTDSDLNKNVGSAPATNLDLGTLLCTDRDQSERDFVVTEEVQIVRTDSELINIIFILYTWTNHIMTQGPVPHWYLH